MKITRATLTLGTSLALVLAGCGGGATPPGNYTNVPRATQVPTAPYAPNYAAAVGSGFHWNHSDLNVFIDAPATDPRVALVKEGAEMWSSFPGSSFHFTYVDSAQNADIKVSFVAPSELPAEFAGNTTTYHMEPSLELTSAEVQLRTDVPNANIATLTTHEFGHALGINGHSDAKDDTMYPVAPNPGRVTQPDANTIAFFYQDGQGRSTATRGVQKKVKFSIH